MRYLCVHCDKTFEHENEAKKPRCPSCMRVHGVEKVVQAKAPAKRQPPWLWWAVAVLALAGAGIGYAVWAGESADSVTGDAPLAVLDRSAVLGHLRHEGVDARELATMLVPSDPIEAWAERTAGNASGAAGKARAIQRAIRARAQAGAFVPWSFGVPRETQIAPPARILTWLGQSQRRHHLYPIEVASLMVSALRALDVNAMVAEAIEFRGERSPADPSGQLGYFVVAVYPGEVGEGRPTYFDPYGGRNVAPQEARVLTDVQAIGNALGHKALHFLSRESDPERASEASSDALRLDGRAPSLRAVRGAILVATGQPDEGARELEAAKQLRSDAPRRNLLASVYMAQAEFDSARTEVSAALEQYPDFAPGRATLATIHLAQQENEDARAELEEATRIDPELHTLSLLWAAYYATIGNADRAVSYAQRSVQRDPGNVADRLRAAAIYRQVGRYDLMRREAHEVLERTPEVRRERMEELIQRLLGPTALEPVDEEVAELPAEPTEEQGEAPSGDLQLDSPLLGGGQPQGPRLGGGGRQPSLLGGQGLQLGGGQPPPSGGSGGGPRLRLDNQQ